MAHRKIYADQPLKGIAVDLPHDSGEIGISQEGPRGSYVMHWPTNGHREVTYLQVSRDTLVALLAGLKELLANG